MSDEIDLVGPRELATRADSFSAGLTQYLSAQSLPSTGILVKLSERAQVINTLPNAIEPLDNAKRIGALYISKFVAAAVAGLFDAALNYLWDETIRNLRDKVARFDLAYFFDTVLTDPSMRSKFKDESDLEKLDDWQLVKGCRETGIITDIGFRHLDYIRDMRNYASAAHPNHNELTGLQLVSWLQTCIREVLGKEPEGPVVEVRKLLHSLRSESLTGDDVPPIESAIEHLPADLARSLLRSLIGMYCDPQLSASTRTNIMLVAPAVWSVTDEDGRHEAGLKQATLSANGEASRAKYAREFLELVGGLSYLPSDALAVEIGTAVDALSAAHSGWNNFHGEAGPARILRNLVPASGAIPRAVLVKFVKTVALCRIGNGYGVSWAATGMYDEIIGLWTNDAAKAFVHLLSDVEFSSRVRLGSCAAHYKAIAQQLVGQVTTPATRKALEVIIQTDDVVIWKLASVSRFKTLLANVRA